MLQLHGKTYFRLEHYLSASVLDKLNQSTIKEELSKLHSNYYEASDAEAEFEFLKVRRMIVCLTSMNRPDEPSFPQLIIKPFFTPPNKNLTNFCLGVDPLMRIKHFNIFYCLKVCQTMTEYGVHFHRVLPEKRSQTGIMLGVYSKGVLIFEVLNGNRTPVLRFPWRETKKISFTVHDYFSV